MERALVGENFFDLRLQLYSVLLLMRDSSTHLPWLHTHSPLHCPQSGVKVQLPFSCGRLVTITRHSRGHANVIQSWELGVISEHNY